MFLLLQHVEGKINYSSGAIYDMAHLCYCRYQIQGFVMSNVSVCPLNPGPSGCKIWYP